MKILFGADMSFNYIAEYPGDEAVKHAMAEVAPKFAEADFSMLNLENVLGNREDYVPIHKCGPNLISTENFVNYVKELNPTVVGISNNHTGDFGAEAIFNTFKVLDGNGYPHIGAGANIEEAYKPYVFEKDGIKVGVVAVCENEFGGAKKDKSGSSVYNLTRVQRAIDALIGEGIKPVIYFHGGNERNPFPSPGKKEMYRHFVDMGASAVIAMHTHCPQGYETYKGAPIVYSMGNLYFPRPTVMKEFYEPTAYVPSWNYGYLTELDFKDNEITIKTLPYCFDRESIRLLKGDELAEFNKYFDYITSVIQDDDKLGKYFDAWCIKYCRAEDINVHFDESLIPQNHENVAIRRNYLTCEAHNELLENYFVVCYEKRLEESVHLIEEIEMLQQLKIKEQ